MPRPKLDARPPQGRRARPRQPAWPPRHGRAARVLLTVPIQWAEVAAVEVPRVWGTPRGRAG
eukprot:7932523-Pyramimonas_sp.AAC.1